MRFACRHRAPREPTEHEAVFSKAAQQRHPRGLARPPVRPLPL